MRRFDSDPRLQSFQSPAFVFHDTRVIVVAKSAATVRPNHAAQSPVSAGLPSLLPIFASLGLNE
jgi:hypothetical protein